MSFISAQAGRDHAEHFYRLAQMAADELYTQLFGSRARAVLHVMFLREQNEFSHRHTRFLLVEGEIVGMLHGFRAEEAQTNSGKTLWLMLRYAGLQVFRFLFIVIVLRDILGFTGERDSGDFYILFVAIYPRFRGRGYSKRLLGEAERMSFEQNCARLSLDVDERNAVARAAYRRAGFEQISESKKVTIDNERWGVLRLAKSVTPSA
ncbi:MAG: GNAT family N-acetyltransferase [Chloroflexi bacterium]|nr:GNAT family N-acetyltransferase [Chloroflexota bacterium]